jgi:hypothetical protein
MKTFSSKLDFTAIIALAVMSFMVIWFLYMGFSPYFVHYSHMSYGDYLKLQNERFLAYVLVMPVTIVVILSYGYWNRVRMIEIADGTLTVVRKRKPATILLSDIASVVAIPAKEIGFSTYQESTWRRSLVGFTGKYYHKNFGEMQWYCTKSKNHMLLTLKDNRKIAFTPDEPERFVNEVKRCLNKDV